MKETHWLSRFFFLRLLGLVYFVAFLVLTQQIVPLVGSNGILPADRFLARVEAGLGSGWASWSQIPTLFWIHLSDSWLRGFSIVGLVLAVLVTAGFADALILFLLWVLYLSFVHVGQLFYGYGWETMLLETGFLAIFWCPLLRVNPFPEKTPPSMAVSWLLRWLLFRLMFGAGLIKLRGDPCWRELTCLDSHFETQPLPNPLSWYFHHLPPVLLKAGVAFNHLAELAAPWLLFGPRKIRWVGVAIIIVFQVILILSGNLSWLNWLTIAIAVGCLDDDFFRRLLSQRLLTRWEYLHALRPSGRRRIVLGALAVLVAFLSVDPIMNLLSHHQAMNRSFEPLHLVNTYGAFGSISKTRDEIILEGTDDESPGPETVWRPYEFKCKPGDVHRRPCVVAPYQYRIDWQMWFAAMSDIRHNPWLLVFAQRLLENDPGALSLIAGNPFPNRPPRALRAELYEYHFTDSDDPAGAWWRRDKVGGYFPPVSKKYLDSWAR